MKFYYKLFSDIKILIIIRIIIRIIFTQIKHPITLGLILLIQTIIVSIIRGLISETFWLSYILFLIFIGGLLVLFIYITRLAPNEIIKISINIIFTNTILIILLFYLTIYINTKIQSQEIIQYTLINKFNINIILKLYNLPTNNLNIIIASYLFITIIVIVKITNMYKGPLRQIK